MAYSSIMTQEANAPKQNSTEGNGTATATAPKEHRALEAIIEEMVSAGAAKDNKRVKELANEYTAANTFWEAEDRRQAQAAKEQRMAPIREQFVRVLDRTEGLKEYIHTMGGILSFSYAVKEGEEAPVVSINIGSSPVAAAKAAGGGSSGPRAPGAGQRKFIVNGAEVSLGDAFTAVATADEVAELATRSANAKAEGKRTDGVEWSYRNQVVQKAITAGVVSVAQ